MKKYEYMTVDLSAEPSFKDVYKRHESSRKNWLPHWKYPGRLSARWKTDDIILRL